MEEETSRVRLSLEQSREFWCPGCEKTHPYEDGAYDELGELCNDCAVVVWQRRDELRDGIGIFAEGAAK